MTDVSNGIKPLFLFSLARSGSTLLQRILAAHKEVSTASEPWLLLPYLYMLKDHGIHAEYSHKTALRAIEDFCRGLPNGWDDYFAGMHTFVLRLYGLAAKKDSKYFVDKTPRYHLIVEEVIRLFPEGKFIFLWRNPLAVVASIMETWGGRKWNLYIFKMDLFDGLANLVAAYKKHEGRVCAVRYEDLVSQSETECRRMFEYLGLSFYSELLSSFKAVELKGRMGDKIGVNQYQSLSKEPLDKWKSILANPIRKAWCRRYLRWIGNERLQLMGYDMNQLLSDLDAIPLSLSLMGSDLLRMSYGAAYSKVKHEVFIRRSHE